MKVKRIVRINSYGVGGCAITVTFQGIAYRQPCFLDSPYPDIKTPWGGMTGDGNNLKITSRYLATPKEAADWINQLTEEVKTYIHFDQEKQKEYAALEGESFVE